VTNFIHSAGGAIEGGAFWTVGLKSTGAITEAAAEAAWVAAWVAFWGSAGLQALYDAQTTQTACSTSTASATWRQTTISRDVVAHAGTAVTQELPAQLAVVVTSYSALATKYGHGRMFFPPPVAAALTVASGGKLAGANATTIATAFHAWYAILVAAGLTGLLVTKKPTVTGAAQYSTRQIVTWSMQDTLHVQKRRGDKVIGTRTAVYP
jgi:hypothetical protein